MRENYKRKLRIAIWHNLPSGGGKRQLYYHVNGLIERGHHVESWCPHTADQEFLPLSALIKEHVVNVELPYGAERAVRSSKTMKSLMRVMENHASLCAREMSGDHFDVLYVNACKFFRTSPLAKYSNVPSVLYLGEPFRSLYEAQPELPWIAPKEIKDFEWSYHFLKNSIRQRYLLKGLRLQARYEIEYAKHFDRILTNSLYSRESILRAYGLESRVCYLGVDVNYYRNQAQSKDGFVVGLGEINFIKGIDRAIRALAAIEKSKRPSLIWIGNRASRELDKLKMLAHNLVVDFIPKINISDGEVIAILSRAVAMVYTSRLEPFGFAPLEANACGTPVVAIAEGGVRETIRDGVNGFLLSEDDPQKLGALLTRFIDDPELSHSMGRGAREYVEQNWNMKMCIDNLENQLYDVVEKVKK